MPLTYFSGEEILAGDYVLYAGGAARVEFVVQREELDIYGAGFMIHTAKFGRIFMREADEDLDLVKRGILLSESREKIEPPEAR